MTLAVGGIYSIVEGRPSAIVEGVMVGCSIGGDGVEAKLGRVQLRLRLDGHAELADPITLKPRRRRTTRRYIIGGAHNPKISRISRRKLHFGFSVEPPGVVYACASSSWTAIGTPSASAPNSTQRAPT